MYVEIRGWWCYFSIALQFNHTYCVHGESKVSYYVLVLQSFELVMQDSYPSHHSTKALYHL